MTAAQKLTAEVSAESYARGKADGAALGKAEGKAELLLRQLDVRFGSVSDATRQRVLLATPEHLDVWAERIISGVTLEEILA